VLYVVGVHLELYRLATRRAEDYWREGLRRESGDVRCNVAMGWWRYRRGEFGEAALHFGRAVETLTRWNPNPREGEAFYGLGVSLV
jgi:Tfp pilus assembly protein PilF